MTPEERKNCRCPGILCPVHVTKATDRHVGPCFCFECRLEEWKDSAPPKIPQEKKLPNRPDWLKRYSMGLEHGEDWDCLYEGKTWALIRIPGHMYWSSIGSQRYGKTEFEVVRKNTQRNRGGYINAKVDCAEGCNLPDLDKHENANVFNVREGRMNKKLLTSLIEQVDLLDKERP